MNNRFGAYFLSNVEQTLPQIRKLKPAWVVILDPKEEWVEKIKDVSPETKIAGRYYRSDQDYDHGINSNPTGYAQDIVGEVSKNSSYKKCDLLITSNEVCFSWDSIGNLDQFYQELQRLWPGPLGLYSSPVESPPWDREPYDESLMAYMKQLETSMTNGLSHGDIFCAHQYNAPTLLLSDQSAKEPQHNLNYNRVVRYEQHIWPRLPQKLQKLPVLMSEFGWDFLTWPTHRHGGWRDPEGPEGAQMAVNQLKDFARKWDAKYHDIPVVGWVLYCIGDSGGWEKYRLDANKGDGTTLLSLMAEQHPGGPWPTQTKRTSYDKPPVHVHTPKPHGEDAESDFKASMIDHLNRIQRQINHMRSLIEENL